MKQIFIAVFLFASCQLKAQLQITSGTVLNMDGAAQLTLSNIDLVNDGTFTKGTSIVSFIGGTNSYISGSGTVQFYEMEINKSGGTSVLLSKAISITDRITFTAGYLDLNNYNADLGTTGTLINEAAAKRIIGSAGGLVEFSTTLSNVSSVNPANLGAIFTSSANLGTVTIKRGHKSQDDGSSNGSSILRYYDIVPTTNTGLNATLRFNYFDGELNSLTESDLVLWHKTSAVWTNEGYTTRDATDNYVEKTGINIFPDRLTLSSSNNVLPVLFTFFNLKCEGNKILITWKTAQELNSSHFDVERSTDGVLWTVMGTLPAAGNSSTEKIYLFTDNYPVFTDNYPVQNSFYRIAQYDINGDLKYTGILRSSCNTVDVFNVWPNPVTDMININITADDESQATISVFDSKGVLVKKQTETLLNGNNLLNVYLKELTLGSYQLSVEWNDGQLKKAVKLIKQ